VGSFPENDSPSLGRTKEDDLCVGVETCRGLTGGILVDDGEALVGCPSLLFSLLRETWPGTFCHGQSQDAIDGRGDTPTRAESSIPASLLQREKDRKRGWG
jgi:hypothetical protein